LVAGLVLAALASIYSQLLYAVTNASAVQVAAGAEWMHAAARWIVDLRVIVLPVLLPLLAVVYSFASRTAAEMTTRMSTVRDRASVIRDRASTISERAQMALTVAPDVSNVQLAEILGCSPSAVSRARNARNNHGDAHAIQD
jgi:hypothetical protein